MSLPNPVTGFLRKSAEAIRCAWRHREGARVISLEDGPLNSARTSSRPHLGDRARAKNRLFAGSDGGVKSWVIPNDNFDLLSSHVLPALLAKIDAAARECRGTVEVWGSGRPRREFLHVDDLAGAVVFSMKTWSEEEPINIASGTDVTIAELAELIAAIVGYTGRFVFEQSNPDGTRRKLLDVAKLTALGWRPRIPLDAGIRQTYECYRTPIVGTR